MGNAKAPQFYGEANDKFKKVFLKWFYEDPLTDGLDGFVLIVIRNKSWKLFAKGEVTAGVLCRCHPDIYCNYVMFFSSKHENASAAKIQKLRQHKRSEY